MDKNHPKVTDDQYFRRTVPQRKNHKSMSGEEPLEKVARKNLTRNALNRTVRR